MRVRKYLKTSTYKHWFFTKEVESPYCGARKSDESIWLMDSKGLNERALCRACAKLRF